MCNTLLEVKSINLSYFLPPLAVNRGTKVSVVDSQGRGEGAVVDGPGTDSGGCLSVTEAGRKWTCLKISGLNGQIPVLSTKYNPFLNILG